MKDKKLTDNEIVKALECCNYIETDCELCPLYTTKECSKVMLDSTLDLINRLQAENENLKEKNSNLTSDLTSLKNDLISLQAENERLSQFGGILLHNGSELFKELQTAKAEAYKEFAEKVKDIDQCTFDGWIEFPEDRLDNLLKELVGDNNAKEKE